MHQALYRKWRPQTFDEVCGQDHITSILRYEAEHRSFSHAYLFCGSRGTGKTTCAKILAKAINCLHPVNGNPCGVCEACRSIDSGVATDVLEMDAASNNGVDNIRDIRDEVVYSPSSLRFRVYIIDEVHMLSVSAFNALLKTLEEPPEHVVFILATTELQKLPATIISRCQRFDFRRISTDALVARLETIAGEESIRLAPDAARMIAGLAQGGMRDAISLLELCAGGARNVTVETVEEAVGLTGRGAMLSTVKAIADKDFDALFARISEVVASSKDLVVFWQDLIGVYRDMLVVRSTKRATEYLDLSDREREEIETLSARFSKETLLYHCKLLEESLFAMQKSNAVKRVLAEMTLVRMCDEALDTSTEALISRIAKLEDRMITGAPMPRSEQPVPPSKPEKSTSGGQIEPPKSPPTASKPAPVPVGTEPGKRVLHPIRNWMEVVDRTRTTAVELSGFLMRSKGYTTDDGRVIVKFDHFFSKEMAERGDRFDVIRAAVSHVLRREVPDRSLIFEVEEAKSDRTVIDEIIEATDSN